MPKPTAKRPKEKTVRQMWEEQKQFHANDKLYGTATIGAKGQVVIPAGARKDFEYKSGDQLMVLGNKTSKTMILVKSGTLDEFLGLVMKQLSGSGLEGDVRGHFEKLFGTSLGRTRHSKNKK